MGAMTIKKANDLSPHAGISLVCAGPPGTGKSWFLGTMAGQGPTLLLATLSREVNSVQYQKHNVDVVMLEDLGWRPTSGHYNAEAYTTFLEIIEGLYEDDHYRNVIIDSGTELAEAAWHEALKPWSAASPADMEDKRSRWLPYETLDILLDQGIKAAVGLTKLSKLPKNVGIAWHVQPPKDDTYETVGDTKVKKESADRSGEGLEYEGKVLPMIRGRFRRRLAAQVDAFVYTDIIWTTESKGVKKIQQPRFVVQVRPDKERHTKLPGPVPEITHIDNNWSDFMNLIEQIKVKADEEDTTNAAKPAPTTVRDKSASKTTRRRLKGRTA